jgi:hypothetical protein
MLFGCTNTCQGDDFFIFGSSRFFFPHCSLPASMASGSRFVILVALEPYLVPITLANTEAR